MSKKKQGQNKSKKEKIKGDKKPNQKRKNVIKR
jgi:hypothetical protein